MDALAPNEVGQQPLRAGCCAPDALTVAAPERLNVKPCYVGAEGEVATKAGPIHPSGGQPYWPFESLALRHTLRDQHSPLASERAKSPTTTSFAHKPPDCDAAAGTPNSLSLALCL